MPLLNLSPLKHVNFRRLYLSQLISVIGNQMTIVTIPFQIYALTGSTFQTGLVSGIELVCLVATALWGGVLADNMDRRKIIIVSEVVLLFLVALLALNALLPTPSLLLIYLLAGLLAAVSGFHRPAYEALTPMLVPKAELALVSPLASFKYVFAALIGPTIAGFLVATVGPFYTYVCDFLSFAVSLQLLLRIAPIKLQSAKIARQGLSWFKEVGEGIRYLRSRRDILGSYVVDFCAMVFCMPHVLFPAFAKMYAHNELLGTLYMSVALGSMVAALGSGWTPRVKRLGVAISCAAMGWSLSIFTVGLVSSFWAIPIGLFCAGACDGYSGMFRGTMWNESIPDEFRGRLGSFGMLSYMSGPLLGNTIIGFIADQLGVPQALAWGGAISAVAVLLTASQLPAFWHYRSPSH